MTSYFSRLLPRVCVLDPSLALSPCGIQLVQRLGQVLELWIAREFWSFTQQVDLWGSLQDTAESRPPEAMQAEGLAWQMLQDHLSPADLPLYWYGDRLWESHLPTLHPPQALSHWELLAESLETRLPRASWDTPLLRDTLALAAIFPHRFVLTYQSQPDLPPRLCSVMEQAQLPCHQLSGADPLAQLQRQLLQNDLIEAGLETLQWGYGPLAMLKLSLGDAGAIPTLFTKRNAPPSGISPSASEQISIENTPLTDPWQRLQGFWQSL
jgi:hypothetical protein